MNLESLINLPKDKKILILGLGKENLQFLDWMVDVVNFPLDQIYISDKTTKDNLNHKIPKSHCFFGENYLDCLQKSEIEYVFKSPGIWSLLPEIVDFANQKGQDKVNSSLILFFQKFRNQIVAITGTKGKSTTSSLVNHFLNNLSNGVKSVYCGNTTNISPYTFWTNLYQEIDPQTYFVVETSSFQLQDLGFAEISPKYSIITNYYIDHLDQHKDENEYWQAKDNIYKFQKEGDFLVFHEQLLSIRKDLLSGAGEGAKIVVTQDISRKISHLLDSKLVGEHNQSNLALAVIMTQIVNSNSVDLGSLLEKFEHEKQKFKQIMSEFKPLHHRLELIKSHIFSFDYLGAVVNLVINFYDDGYATEPDAVIAATKALISKPNEFLWLIVAGKDKGSGLVNLANQILEIQLRDKLFSVDYMGQLGQNLLKNVYNQLGVDLPIGIENLHETVNLEFVDLVSLENKIVKFFVERWVNYEEIGQPQKVVTELKFPQIVLNIVLSPGGSSFDEFENVTARADWWVSKINSLK